MKFQIYKVIKHLFLLFFIFLIPLCGFTQDNSWQVNQKGYWEKINEGLGISYRGNGNKGIVAAGPNSVVAMRRSKAGNAPYHRAEGESFFTILKSTDKGDTWQTLYKDTNDWALGYDIGHPTENVTGWLMRKGYGRTPKPMFKYTTDGGRTINSLEHQVGGGKIKGDEAINVSMYDAKHWAFTTHDEFSLKDHTYVYITHDGGKTWEEKHLKVDPSKLGVYQVVMRTPDKISLFPKFQGDAKTRISTDGGKTWQTYSEMPDKAIGWKHSIEFTGPETGYVGGQFHRGRAGPDTGKIFKTTDGGRSWDLILNTLLPAPVNGIFEIDFINKKEGLAFGKWEENMLRTTDGGKTWIRDSVVSDKSASGLELVYTQKGGEKLALALAKGRGDVFRYKATDTTSSTTGKDKVKSREQGLAIYPNPSDGRLQIRWQGKNAVPGKLYNMQGQVVHHFNLTLGQQETYSLSGIKPGTYIFKVNGRDITKKVLIQGQAD